MKNLKNLSKGLNFDELENINGGWGWGDGSVYPAWVRAGKPDPNGVGRRIKIEHTVIKKIYSWLNR